MVRSLLNQNKMLVERVTNLEGQISKKKKEELQVTNDIRVISYKFFILQFSNDNFFNGDSIIIQSNHFISLYISQLIFQGASPKDF